MSVVLVPLFLGIVQLALVWHVRTTLTSAASEGARYGAAYDKTVQDGARRTGEVIDEIFGTDFADEVGARATAVSGQPGVEVDVSARVPVLGVLGSHHHRRGGRARGQGGRAVKAGRRGSDQGSALVELTWLGLLLMVPLVYVIVSIITVQRSAFGATEAARAAGRAYILAPDVGSARVRAFEAARVAMHDQGVELAPSDLMIVCRPTPESCLQPGSTVEVRIDLEVGLPLVPAIFGESAASVSVDASHREPFGDYREAR